MRSWLSHRRKRLSGPISPKRPPEKKGTQTGIVSTKGVFAKCEGCGKSMPVKELRARYNVCPSCEFHHLLPAWERIRLLTDPGTFLETDAEMTTRDPLHFEGYRRKLESAQNKTGLKNAVVCGTGSIGGQPVALAVMDFRFIGGSMGSVVGEKVTRTVETAEGNLPLITVSASGGARMFEGIYSLMQMAKVSVALCRFTRGSLPHISILTDPTFGGVTASFATAADFIIAEPGARIGFAGARVIEGATNEKLPQGFQTAEFQLEHGMIDRIVHRLSLKNDLERLLEYVT